MSYREIDWPKNVPRNLSHGQVWLVNWKVERRRPYYHTETGNAYTVIARRPDSWPEKTPFGFVRSVLRHGNLYNLGFHEAVDNMQWLIEHEMRPGDWAQSLDKHAGCTINYDSAYRLCIDDNGQPYLKRVLG